MIVALVSCSLAFPVPDVDESADGRDGGGVTAEGGPGGGAGREGGGTPTNGDSGPAEAAAPSCVQTGKGPALVPAGARVCVDSTPVTRDEYSAFLAAGYPVTGQIPGCEDNTSYTPLGSLDPGDAGPILVDGADWCDAVAFCSWAGKTLCGGFPGSVLPEGGVDADGGFTHGLTQTQAADRDASAFAWACEDGDKGLVYPYSNDDDPKQCYQPGFFGQPPLPPGPVGSTGCVGGYPGLVDMVGVPEYVDACDVYGCVVMGASACRDDSNYARMINPDYYPQYVGLVAFRCCGLDAPR